MAERSKSNGPEVPRLPLRKESVSPTGSMKNTRSLSNEDMRIPTEGSAGDFRDSTFNPNEITNEERMVRILSIATDLSTK